MDPLGPAAWRIAQHRNLINQRIQKMRLAQRARKEYRQEKIRERVRRIKIIQDHDRQVDKALLYDAPLPIETLRPQGRPWFVSRDMSGDPGYVLQWLGALVKASLPDDALLAKIDDWFGNWRWQTDPFQNHYNDRVDKSGEYVLAQRLRWLDRVCQDPNEKFDGNPPDNERTWDHIKNLFEFLNSMKLLERFVDPRNPETVQKPLPDGTNLESGVLRASWVLHRAWIRALHYRTLFAGTDSFGWVQLQHILKLVLAFHEAENGEIPKDRLPRPEFNILYRICSAVSVALAFFTTELWHETRPQPVDGEYTDTETVLYNIQHERFENHWIKHFAPIDKTFILWAQLLKQAEDFEKRGDVEHVEDVLIDKRVVGRDERYELDTLMDGTYRQRDISHMPTNYRTVLDVLSEISRINRHRRNFLLLRDWSKKRPWHQLYYIFNTADGAQDYLLKPIEDFYTMISGLVAVDPPPHFTGPSPSRISNIWASLFTFHPIASTSPTQLQGVNYDDGCVICQYNFVHSQSIVQLHCKHLFHYPCIRDYWDVPGRHTFRCPLCAQGSVNWLLHEQAGITPEVLDVWDNEEVVDANWACEHPDIQDQDSAYWINENNKLLLSRHWNQEFGRTPRDVSCEMARVRQDRRRRNQLRREWVAREGTGIAGLDPAPAEGA